MEDQNKTQPVEQEEVSVLDTPVTIERQADDTLTVLIPTGLTDEVKAKIHAEIEKGEVSSLVKALQRKNQIMNEEKAEIEKIKAELAKPKAKEQPKQDTTTEHIPLWKRVGLESEADLDEWAADNPARYTRELAKDEFDAIKRQQERELEARLAKLNEETSRQQLMNRIASNGDDPLDVQAFAHLNAISNLDRAYTLYLQLHRDKSDPVLAAQREAQKKQINYIEQSHFRQKSNLSEAELENLPEEELDEYIKYIKEKAARDSG